MGTVLMTWELGSGLGHMASIRPLAMGLLDRGHRVVVAIKNFSQAHRILDDPRIELLGAPTREGNLHNYFPKAVTFAHVLHNVGFGDLGELESMTGAWKNLYGLVKPDLIVCDHSPTAILAARTTSLKVAPLGTGFYCPAAGSPLPDWRPEAQVSPERLAADEAFVLQNVNKLLRKWRQPELSELTDLYEQADEKVLITYPELDAFPNRHNAEYSGIWPELRGEPPQWPDGNGVRVFAYLRPRAGLQYLLSLLAKHGFSTILRVPGVSDGAIRKYQAPNLLWEKRLIDVEQVTRECDFCINHSTHVMSSSVLLAGKPMLMIPPFLEQSITAKRIMDMGAGVATKMEHEDHMSDALSRLINGLSQYTRGAMQFADRYQPVDRNEKVEQAVDRLDVLIPSS